jgi:hypothetical protein
MESEGVICLPRYRIAPCNGALETPTAAGPIGYWGARMTARSDVLACETSVRTAVRDARGSQQPGDVVTYKRALPWLTKVSALFPAGTAATRS